MHTIGASPIHVLGVLQKLLSVFLELLTLNLVIKKDFLAISYACPGCQGIQRSSLYTLCIDAQSNRYYYSLNGLTHTCQCFVFGSIDAVCGAGLGVPENAGPIKTRSCVM